MFTRADFARVAKELPRHFDAVTSTLDTLVFVDPNYNDIHKKDEYHGPSVDATYIPDNEYSNSGALLLKVSHGNKTLARVTLSDIKNYNVDITVLDWLVLLGAKFFKPEPGRDEVA